MTAHVRVVVNADDLGLLPEIDAAVARAHEAGTVTSATLLVSGASAEAAAEFARGTPTLGVGLHIDLVTGRPLASGVPSLVGADGRFLGRAALLRRALRSGVTPVEVAREVHAQLGRMHALGLKPTHFDAHQHAQVIPGVSGVIAHIARDEGLAVRVPTVRLRREARGDRLVRRLSLWALCAHAERSGLRPATVEFTSVFDLGRHRLVVPDTYVRLVREARGPTIEIMVHPSLPSPALRELHPDLYDTALAEATALLAPGLRDRLQAAGADLVTFRSL